MKKIAILNDIHGNLYLLNKALQYLKNENISLYLICGDFLTDGPDDNKIIDIIKYLPSYVILGNREETLITLEKNTSILSEKMNPLYYTYLNLTKENIKYLKLLNKTQTIKVNNKIICLSHGSPYKTRDSLNQNSKEVFNNLIKDYSADIYLFAHTHKYFSKTYQNKLFINSGAVSSYIGKKQVSTFGILTINDAVTSYEQIELKIDFNELKNYYIKSNYYKAFPKWNNIILYSIKDGVSYNKLFSKEYIDSLSLKENYNNFIIKYNLK